jgi:hypothetical protein
MLFPNIQLTITTMAIAFAVGLSSGGAAGVYASKVYWQGFIAREKLAAQDASAKDGRAEEIKAKAYAEWVRKQQPKTITIEREVSRAIENSGDWGDVRVPRGVRESLERARTETGAGDPDGAVPAPAASAD